MSTQTLQKWNKVRLGDVAEIESGGTPSSTKPEYWDGGDICWATLPDLENKYLFDTQRKITPLGLKNSSAKLLPINSVIFSSRATIGEVAITKVETSTNQGSKNFICDPTKIDYEFLYYLLKNKVEEINNLASGATYKEINKTVFSAVEIEIPNIPVQKQSAQVLAVYDDLIYNNTCRIKILEQMAQAIYTEWFVNFHFPGHEKVKMVDSKTDFGKIPEEWAVRKIREVGRIVTGKTPPTSDAKNFGDFMPFIKTPDLHNSIFCISTNENLSMQGVEKQKNKVIPNDSIVVSCIGTIGVVGITTRDSQTNQQINSIVPTQTSVREYLYFVCVSLKDHLKNIGANGATMGNVNKEKFETIEILSPSDAILGLFHDTTQEMFDEIKSLSYQNQSIKQSRDLLLPKLVIGEIRV